MMTDSPTTRLIKLIQTMIIKIFELAMWSIIILITSLVILMILDGVFGLFPGPKTYYGPCGPDPFDGCE